MQQTRFLNKKVNLLGKELQIQDHVEVFGSLAGTFEDQKFDNQGKYTIIATYPSIDTHVCDMQVARLESLAQQHLEFNFVGLSQDLPSALATYAQEHEVKNTQLFSDYKNHQMALNLGLLIEDYNLFARSMLVLNPQNQVVYKQINDDVHAQVDFDRLLEFLSTLK